MTYFVIVSADLNKKKPLFTPGPASLCGGNLSGIKPFFGRGDYEYDELESRVLKKLRLLAGQEKIIRFQGSASLGLEIIAANFLFGSVLIIVEGYYGERLTEITNAHSSGGKIKEVTVMNWNDFNKQGGFYDWVFCAYTETSNGKKIDLKQTKRICEKMSARLAVDATASIGLELDHELADVLAFSSCKGLFGLTGAGFVASKKLPEHVNESFYLSYETHMNKKVTGPYHTIGSLDPILARHSYYAESVKINKEKCLVDFKNYLVHSYEYQPLLCTALNCKVKGCGSEILYIPRVSLVTSVICHLGEVHLGKNAKGVILESLRIEK